MTTASSRRARVRRPEPLFVGALLALMGLGAVEWLCNRRGQPQMPADPQSESPPVSNERGTRARAGRERDQLREALRRRQPALSSACWAPALQARQPDAPTSIRLLVELEIQPSGSVGRVRVAKAPGYPGLAECVRKQVGAWRFDPAEHATRVRIPLTFVADQ